LFLRAMAWELGKAPGLDPATNAVIASMTNGGATNPQPGTVQLRSSLSTPAEEGHYYTASAWFAVVHCKNEKVGNFTLTNAQNWENPVEHLFLLTGNSPNDASPIAQRLTPNDGVLPCTDPNATISIFGNASGGANAYVVATAGAGAAGGGWQGTGTGAGNITNNSWAIPVHILKIVSTGDAVQATAGINFLGVMLTNTESNGTGNDGAFDTYIITDSTPQLDKHFSPAAITLGSTSTLVFTITNTTDLLGKNGWSFTDDLPPPGLVAVAGSAITTCGSGTLVSITDNGTKVTVSDGRLPENAPYCTIEVKVTPALLGVYTNDAKNITSLFGLLDPGTGVVGQTLTVTPAVSSFNAFETTTHNAAVDGVIHTKRAGAAFDLGIVAIEKGAVLTSFDDNVDVDLLANTGSVGDVSGAGGCPAKYSVIKELKSVHIKNGRIDTTGAAFNPPTRAWRDVRVRITYEPSTGTPVMNCSTDNFAIRPLNFVVTGSTKAHLVGVGYAATTSAYTGAISASSMTTPLIAGDSLFDLTATGMPGYDGTPQIDTSKISGRAVIASNKAYTGAFSGSFNVADPATGAATGDAFKYSEVGYFTIGLNAIYDKDFTAVDQNQPGGAGCIVDGNSIIPTIDGNGLYGCTISNAGLAADVGRFIPHHFAVKVTPACSNSPPLTSFTYSGQPFAVRVTAYNGLTTPGPGVTRNYDATAQFAKQVTLTDPRSPPLAGKWIDNSEVIAASAFALGIADATRPTFAFLLKPGGPGPLQVRAMENMPGGDKVDSEGYDDSTLLRLGRLRLFNAFGNAQQPLVMQIQAQYWSGKSWVLNSDDSCTTLDPTNIYVDNPAITWSVSPVLNGGTGTLTLNKPANGLTTSVDVAINLGPPSSVVDNSCLATHGGSPANESWLRSRNGSGTHCPTDIWTADPAAHATFGIYSPENERMIHRRELFR
jgi:hypothetical protein